ncbi:MAG: hypothetical protein IT210_06155 [Armatimonadetes bacterium]|nr:hypothetical protein [Armatimonadota bacterium]
MKSEAIPESPSPVQSESRFSPGKVTIRSVLLGLVLIFPNNYWIIQNERVREGPYFSILSLYANVVVTLLALLGWNALVRRRFPRLALTGRELLVVYVMLAMATTLCGMDIMQCLIVMLPHGIYFASPENRWGATFLKLIPRPLLIRDKEAVTGYFAGASSMYRASHLRAWAEPLAVWIVFLTVVVFVLMCLSVLLRRRWVDHERLPFPVTQLPIELALRSGGLFRQKAMWTGLGIAACIDLLNGLHVYFPAVPRIQVAFIDLAPFITVKPWNAVGWFPVSFYPIIIGMGFMLPVDLLFSCWFFYFFWKGQKILASAAAWDTIPNFPFTNEQILGGCVGLAAALLWSSRGYGRQVLAAACRKPGSWSDAGEGMSYRAALLGFCAGTAFLLAFSRWAGMSWAVSLLFFGLYLLSSLVVARIRAELGAPAHDFFGESPSNMITSLAHADRLMPADRAMLGMYWSFTSGYQNHPMPYAAEGMQIARKVGLDQKRLLWASMLAAVAGMAATAWAFLHLAYRLGAAAKFHAGTGYAWTAYNQLSDWTTLTSPPGEHGLIAALAGCGFTLLLSMARARWLGWPFHPIAYLISGNWCMNLIWLPLFISWILKGLTLRYGGLNGYRKALPFFLGLILGECVVGSFWSLLGIVLNIPNYCFWGA